MFYVILLLPNNVRFHEEIIFIPTKNKISIIYKPNFLKTPQIYEPTQHIIQNHGIMYYEKSNIPLFFLHKFYTTDENILNYYKNLTPLIYVGSNYHPKLDATIYYTPKYDKNQSNELLMLQYKKFFYTFKNQLKIIYIFGFEFVFKE